MKAYILLFQELKYFIKIFTDNNDFTLDEIIRSVFKAQEKYQSLESHNVVLNHVQVTHGNRYFNAVPNNRKLSDEKYQFLKDLKLYLIMMGKTI